MKPLISDTLGESLVGQLADEKRNANLYLSIASYLNGKGLSMLAKRFEEQYEEENSHALMIYRLLSDLGFVFVVPTIDEYSASFETIKGIAELYLLREQLTTESLGEIKKLAVEEDNHVVEQAMRELISKQQEEYAEATDFCDKASMLPEWWQVSLWDLSLRG
jgi:ferritin